MLNLLKSSRAVLRRRRADVLRFSSQSRSHQWGYLKFFSHYPFSAWEKLLHATSWTIKGTFSLWHTVTFSVSRINPMYVYRYQLLTNLLMRYLQQRKKNVLHDIYMTSTTAPDSTRKKKVPGFELATFRRGGSLFHQFDNGVQWCHPESGVHDPVYRRFDPKFHKDLLEAS